MSRAPGRPPSALPVISALLVAFSVVFVAPRSAGAVPSYPEGEIIIKFRANASPSDVQSILGDLGATRIQRFRRIRAEHERITRSVSDAVARYRNHPAVEFIEPNYTLQVDAVPNDPSFSTQWSLQNTGQLGGTPGADIDAVPAWDVETGSAQTLVGIIDTGVDYNHPDLAANMFTNPGEIAGNGVDDDANGFVDDVRGWDFLNNDNNPMDDNGHGTHVAGTIGAVGNNAVGVAGVAWNVRILPLKFLSASGSGPTSAAIQCVEYATAMGVAVTNNSWGGGGYSEALRQAILDAEAAGILFVAAAGNASTNTDLSPHYPSTYNASNIISVASTTRTDALSGFSNFGVQTVDLAAPGSEIYSTTPQNSFGTKSGTSMAAPHVTGAVALLRSHFPYMPAPAAKALILASSDPIPALAGLVGSGGRLNVLRMLEGPDTLPPAPVSDLSVQAVGFDRVTLAFTAPGDDGLQGAAAHYDIRFSTSPIDASSFESATPFLGAPAPHASGSPEQVVVEPLDGYTVYYLALRVMDEYGNASPVSNVVSAQTTGPPIIVVEPASLETGLQTGASASLPFAIRNIGEGTLAVSIAPDVAAAGVATHEALDLAKGAADPRPGFAGSLGGGPDLFGYTWTDSDAPGGPGFQWEDISATGTLLPLTGDDEMSGAVPIGFPFPYYGNTFTQVFVCSNGFLSFDPGASPIYTNQILPSIGAPRDMIAPLWDDLFVEGGGSNVRWQSDGSRLIVQWTAVPHLGGPGPYTFQVVLDRLGTILFRYQALGSGLSSPTVGIQNGTGTDGLTAAFNSSSYPHQGLAIRFAALPPWLSASPESGSIPAGGSMTFHARVDAEGLNGGTYDGRLRITSNDPYDSPRYLPVRLNVTGAPDIAVDPEQLVFGPVFVGGNRVRLLQVRNSGFETLHVTGIAATAPYTVDGAPFDLAPGTSRDVSVSFPPVVPGPAPGSVTIQSNDPGEPVLTVPATGEGLIPPDIAVSPASISAALLTGGTDDRAITISNTGGSPLEWSVRPGAGGVLARPYAFPPIEPASTAASDGADAGAGAGPARADSMRASLADLAGVRILFDAAHGNAPPANYWSVIIGNLTARGAQVAASSVPLTPDLLHQAEILWVTDLSQPWSSTEIAAVRDWVVAGGSLLLEGDNYPTVPVYNAILTSLGLPASYVAVYGADGITTRIHPHPATRNVQSVLLIGSLAHLGTVGPQQVVLVDDVAGTPNTAAALVGGGRVLMMADELFENYRMPYANNQLLANQAFDWLAGLRWLTVSPGSGTTPAGGQSVATARLNATGVGTGVYRASLVASSNDPDEPEVAVDVELSVTGAPDVRVAPASLAFGPLFVGDSRTDSIGVSNEGMEDLHVALALDHPDFSTDAPAFTLAPGGRQRILVTYRPQALGDIAAALTVSSDDPDSPSLTVGLTAIGLPAPDADVTPASFDEALDTGQVVTRALSVANLSGSPLQFSIRVEDTTGGAGAPSGPGATEVATEPWSVLRARAVADSTPTDLPPSIASGLPLPVVIVDPAGDGGPVDLTTLRASGRAGMLEIELELAAPVQSYDFGGVVSLDTDRNRFTGRLPSYGLPAQDIGAEFEFSLFPLGYGYVELYDANGSYRGSFPVAVNGTTIRWAAPLSALGNDDGAMDVTGVIGTGSGPTDWFPDAGHGTIGGWLKADPAGGVVQAGGSAAVQLTFDATDLDGGDYTADVVVATNDPDEREVRVPAHLLVHGVPLLSIEPGSLDFDSVFVGQPAVRELVVGNVGSAVLLVASVVSSGIEFHPDPASFDVAPRTSRRVVVTFSPQSAGPRSATLEVTHNAEGTPTSIPLSGTGVVPPVMSLHPDAITAAVPTDGRLVQPLRVGNTGGSDLHFAVDLLSGAVSVAVADALDLPHGAPDPRVGPPVTLGSGGPDQFGYRWIDSDQPGGPVFDWVEIRDIGTRIPMRFLDENTGPFPIGFTFPFYGQTFTHFRACTHGWISFTSAVVQWTNQPLPSGGAPENLLAIFWEDQNFSNVERAYYYNDGTRLIVEYDAVPATGGGGPYTYQAILYPSGTIVYQYLRMGAPTSGATVGIQNGTRTDGLTVAFNASYVRDGLAVRFSAAPGWLRVQPMLGSVPPGGEAPLEVTTDATGLFPGDYQGRIDVSTNDPARPRVTVPASLHVYGVPRLAVNPNALSFGTLYTGQTRTLELRLSNVGTDVLEVSGLSFGRPDFSVDVSALSLAPLQSRVVTVSFTPGEAGDRSTTLAIASNDPDAPLSVPIQAAALDPPVLALAPAGLTAAATPGGLKEKSIRLSNVGGSDLVWTTAAIQADTAAEPFEGLELTKGEPDPRAGIEGTGGPDAFGHVWLDSDDPAGPAYSWFDIGSVGTVIPFASNADDENRGPFPIGFAFPFYGGTFEEFRACTNGWISFTSTLASFTNQPLPSAFAGSPENLIAAVWDDLILDPTAASRVLYWSDGERLIVQYEHLRPFGVFSPVVYDFQIELLQSGEIRIRYQSVGSQLSGSTVGIQNGARTDGLTVAFNAAYLHPGLEVRFDARPRWLDVSPRSGTIPAGGHADVTARFDASQLEAGDYAGTLRVQTNELGTSLHGAPCLFHVGTTEAAVSDFEPNTLNLDSRGRWIIGRAELPAPLDPARVLLATVRALGTVAAESLSLGDFNANGTPDLELYFPRLEVEAALPEGPSVPIAFTGEVEDQTIFVARDSVRCIRPRVTAPNGGETWLPGAVRNITWQNPAGWRVDEATLYYSVNGGGTWSLIADHVIGTSYSWTLPAVSSANVRVRVYASDASGVMGFDSSDGPFAILSQITAVEAEEAPPAKHELYPNAPNPFNPSTSIRFDLPAAGDVALQVFDVAGRRIRTLVRQTLPAGRHRILWDGRDDRGADAASGVYFYRVEVSGARPFEKNRRMILVR